MTLQCTKDAQFIVVVARDATLPNLDLETITFFGDDQNCNALDTTSAFAIYQFPVTACGTVMRVRVMTHLTVQFDLYLFLPCSNWDQNIAC